VTFPQHSIPRRSDINDIHRRFNARDAAAGVMCRQASHRRDFEHYYAPALKRRSPLYREFRSAQLPRLHSRRKSFGLHVAGSLPTALFTDRMD
jgi:hypothetical protein